MLPFALLMNYNLLLLNSIQVPHSVPHPLVIHYRVKRMLNLETRLKSNSVLQIYLELKRRHHLPDIMSQKTLIGSSPTPWPSGSIQYMPEVSAGLDKRASLQVLGIAALFPIDGFSSAIFLVDNLDPLLVCRKCCRSFRIESCCSILIFS